MILFQERARKSNNLDCCLSSSFFLAFYQLLGSLVTDGINYLIGRRGMTKEKNEKKDGIFKEMLDEIGGSIIFEVFWNIIMFIQRMIIRLITSIW
jgi:hypothetical protein